MPSGPLRIHLIHWKPAEAAPRIAALQKLGHEVIYIPPDNSGTLKHVRASAPGALLIDLSRVPSHGKAVAIEMRRHKALRSVPLVFVDGEPEKVAPLREMFPDACFTTWPQVAAALKQLKPPAEPVVPIAESSFERYAGRPLGLKLALKPDISVWLENPPANFHRLSADFPVGIDWQTRPTGATSMAFLFSESEAQLEIAFAAAARLGIPIWVFWPKQASGRKTGLTQHVARSIGQAFGYADCKVCRFDTTWSGFLFRPKRS